MFSSKNVILFVLSVLVVAFGQPAWNWILGIIASTIGFALFFQVLLSYSSAKKRFWLGTTWFAIVQLVQTSWSLTHPYGYIYAVWIIYSLVFGMQFGILAWMITPKRLKSILGLLSIPALWTLFEWSRLFILSGLTFNPVGLALSSSVIPMQVASLVGVYGMSFWVIFVNLLAVKAWQNRKWISAWGIATILPFAYGLVHISYHSQKLPEKDFKAILVQTAFPAEEALPFKDHHAWVAYVVDEWRHIFQLTQQHQGKEIDLIALPECVVPFDTFACWYPYDVVRRSIEEIAGTDSLSLLPPPSWPLAMPRSTDQGEVLFVNNGYWVQSLANIFKADVLAGLEDSEGGESYSAALYFRPNYDLKNFAYERYEKRVLVPMGEYIPFEVCKQLAASYGITGSFTCGKEAKVICNRHANLGPSICYEETFGDLMRENKLKGAEVLVNLTSDVWYPNSRLPQQHLDHARLRTVENGIPLIRACNTGITGAIDNLGCDIKTLGDDESIADALYVEVPMSNYRTLYSILGDSLILGLSFILLGLSLRFDK